MVEWMTPLRWQVTLQVSEKLGGGWPILYYLSRLSFLSFTRTHNTLLCRNIELHLQTWSTLDKLISILEQDDVVFTKIKAVFLVIKIFRSRRVFSPSSSNKYFNALQFWDLKKFLFHSLLFSTHFTFVYCHYFFWFSVSFRYTPTCYEGLLTCHNGGDYLLWSWIATNKKKDNFNTKNAFTYFQFVICL